MSQSIAIQSRRKDNPAIHVPLAYTARAVLGTCIGSSVALYGWQASAAASPEVRAQVHSVAMLAAAISLMVTGFVKIQMVGVASRTHRVKLDGQKKEIFVRRRSEVLGWLVRRWMVFLVCAAAALGALHAGLAHYQVQLPLEPMERALSEVARMSQDVTLLLCALGFSTATLVLSETMLRLSSKAGIPNQAAWIYLPAIASMAATLHHLGAR
ncbi:MAG: hypothetical protein HY303_03625 [Candidatus Wallbacteria bacterium]|nr:hypothetical protein [Candidatus Wallbacteria bacterium]